MNHIYQPKKLILASASPRRQEILKNAGISFSVNVKSIEENFPSSLPVKEVPEFLARLKAEAFKSEINDEVILTADTVVLLNNEVIGKPKDYQDAFKILRSLSGNKHEVVTGVCIRSKNQQISFSDLTEVYFKSLTDQEIDFYLANWKPFDKAGAYGIQEWIGYIAITKIVGSFYNVMGLPVHLVLENLKKF